MSQQEILNVIDIWVSEGSGWTIDKIDSNYINIIVYQPLNGSSYIELPTELRNSKKELINIKNKDDKCFRWCHVRHLNPQENDSQRILQKHCNKIEKQNSIKINVFGYEEKQPYPIHISKETFEYQMNLL